MSFKKLKFKFHHLDYTTSTNIHALKAAKEESVDEGFVYLAQHQTEGRGQRGTKWYAEAASSLLFSIILRPSLRADEQFLLSQCIALGIYRYIDNLSVDEVNVKWPNDILVEGKKVAGTLIENVLSGNRIQYSVIGVGLNVNQTNFPEFSREATSLKLLRGIEFDLDLELESLLDFINSSYALLQQKEYVRIQKDYLECLYGYRKKIRFKDSEGLFVGKITALLPTGVIAIDREGLSKTYDMKEVQFID